MISFITCGFLIGDWLIFFSINVKYIDKKSYTSISGIPGQIKIKYIYKYIEYIQANKMKKMYKREDLVT